VVTDSAEMIPDRPFCLPGCNRLDGHDGRDYGACMKDGKPLCPFCGGNLDSGEHWRRRGRMYEDGLIENQSCATVN
jgi:hypothetical protein